MIAGNLVASSAELPASRWYLPGLAAPHTVAAAKLTREVGQQLGNASARRRAKQVAGDQHPELR
jgi:hypothetical protein